ncbi:hypothetical protein EW026_g5058 [Hermanssonia centrifuga]|uniref:Uncharacterized protein n=1 Tax=Hermanssonia centrifuga TaxID=98765 RepID=A0A4S4KG67_9APHY|nr:hypothetical protein EW026_g5058 [Hermanssonia centrifuga]
MAYGAFHTFLDYPETLQISGIVVPQLAYVAQTTYVVHQPVRFVENGAPGMLLNNALNQNFQGLQDSQGTPTSNHTAVRISLRIQWPGYPSWQDGIRIVDNTAASRPITRARLAHNIARAVGRFMTDMAQTESNEQRPDWWVASSLPQDAGVKA